MEASAPTLFISVDDRLRHEANGLIRPEYVVAESIRWPTQPKRTI